MEKDLVTLFQTVEVLAQYISKPSQSALISLFARLINVTIKLFKIVIVSKHLNGKKTTKTQKTHTHKKKIKQRAQFFNRFGSNIILD